MFTHRHTPVVAITLLAATIGLTGCGGSGSDLAATQPVDFGQAQPAAPGARSNSLQVFAAGGQQQVVVKTRPGSVLAARPHMHKVHSIPALHVDVVSLDSGETVQDAVSQLQSDPGVVFAEPNFMMRALDDGNAAPAVPAPNDPLFSQQFGPQQIHAPQAWTKTRGAGVTIAIVDTGIDVTHPEFAGKILPGFAVADSTPTQTPPEKDDNGHGTHCAGIAAALANNGFGIAGVAPEAKLLPVKVLSAEGSGSDVGVAEGIVWAADHGANVISMSLGGPGDSQVTDDAVKHALDKGVVVVAAMGNDGDGSKSFPAAIPGVIAVGAVDKAGKIASFSQFGDWISVSAPGVQILSTFPTYNVNLNKDGFPQNFATLDGTSMATPHVAGVAALVRAAHPGLTPAQVKQKLESTAQRHGGQFDIHFGWGIVDAAKAVS